MSRVLLIGVGTPSFIAAASHAGPGLRCAHFARALSADGQPVLLVCVQGGKRRLLRAGAAPAPSALPGVEMIEVGEEDFPGPHSGAELGAAIAAFAPDVLVAATAYASSLATRLGLALPFWADIFGDLMAEAQAKAALCGNDYTLAHFWTLLHPVLETADRFSAVSLRQADALVGQLGLAGRLGSANAGVELVGVVPCAVDGAVLTEPARDSSRSASTGSAGLRGAMFPADAFVVLWSGGFNTWCDTETLLAGLEAAMAAEPALHFVATGGAVRGHDEETYRGFEAAVARSPHRERFHLCGWVDSERLDAYYAAADLGINIERPLYERRLGSENRVVQWMAHGLPCVTTGLSELGRSLISEGLAFPVGCGDAASLGRLLAALAADRERIRATGRLCAEHAARRFDPVTTAGPLLEWCRRPVRGGDAGRPRVIGIGLLSRPGTMVQILEAYLAELSLGQIAYRSLRWLLRRLALGTFRAQR